MKTNLLRCPKCELNGKKEFLGEINNGTLSVMRFHRATTLVDGDNFNVYCGICNDKIYMKRKEVNEGTNSIIRPIGIFGQSSIQISGTIRT